MNNEVLLKAYGAGILANKKASAQRESNRKVVIDFVKSAGKVSFAYDWDAPLKEDDPDHDEKLRSALEDSSVAIRFEDMEGCITRTGLVQELEWNDEEEDVIVRGIDIISRKDGKNVQFECSIMDVDEPLELLSFLDTFCD